MNSASPSAFDRARRWVQRVPAWGWAWAAMSVLLLCQRFAHWQDVPFINDEASFLSAAREQLATGRWASASPFYGTQGVRYGPCAVWFYALIQWLFGDDARTSIAAMCLLFSLAQALAILGLTRAFKLRTLPMLALAAYMASSSFQLSWARLAWDQLVNVCGALLLLVLSSTRLSLWHGLGLGLLVGTALSTHLCSVPLVACIFLVLLVEHWREPKQAAAIGAIAAGVALLINYPYLNFLAHSDMQTELKAGAFTLGGSLSWFAMPAEVAGFTGFESYLGPDWPAFLASIGSDIDWMRFSQAPNALAALALIGLCFGVRADSTPAARRLVRLSLVSWAAYTLFYESRALTHHQHYVFPYWWVILIGLASLLVELQRTSARLALVLLGAIGLITVAQLAFLESWRGFVAEQGGTRQSTAVTLQYRALGDACARERTDIQLANQTLLYDHALRYVAESEPRCRGKRVQICSRSCPPPAPGSAALRLVYQNPTGGRIMIVR
jgi:hypothetical protein